MFLFSKGCLIKEIENISVFLSSYRNTCESNSGSSNSNHSNNSNSNNNNNDDNILTSEFPE